MTVMCQAQKAGCPYFGEEDRPSENGIPEKVLRTSEKASGLTVMVAL